MTRPPPFAEVVLAGFITDPYLEGAILGDLRATPPRELNFREDFLAAIW